MNLLIISLTTRIGVLEEEKQSLRNEVDLLKVDNNEQNGIRTDESTFSC